MTTSTRNERSIEAVERGLRRLRPTAGVVLLWYVVASSTGMALDQPTKWWLVAGGIVLIVGGQAADHLQRRDARAGTAADAVVVAADTAVTVIVATRLPLLHANLSWALLLLPVFVAALRFRMRGMIVIWTLASCLYVLLSLRVPHDMSDTATQTAFLQSLQTVVYRVGILLLVAVPCGYLSDQLLQASTAQRRAEREARQRNAVLTTVVNAGRTIGHQGIDVPETVVTAALDLGFVHVDWLVRLPYAGMTVAHTGRHPMCRRRAVDPAAFGNLAELVSMSGIAAKAGPDDPVAEVAPELDALAFGEVVALPLPDGHDGAVVRAATVVGTVATTAQIDGLELLLAHAAVAEDHRRLIGDLDAARSDLEFQVSHDSLTNLPNRSTVDGRLGAALDAVGPNDPLSVLFLDLDRFKQVNDGLGHAVGDGLLVAAARRLSAAVGESSTVARLGGDEFVAILPATDEEGAGEVAGRIVDSLCQPFRIQGHLVEIGVSIGVVTTGQHIDGTELVRRGDAAMYRAKANGRSQWCAFDPELDRAEAAAPEREDEHVA
ncbi:MAG: GGDEF domain-containing protein [Acidimicrobiales bacterium]